MLSHRTCLILALAACGPGAPESTTGDATTGGSTGAPATTSTSTSTSTTSTSTSTTTTADPTTGAVATTDTGIPFIPSLDACGVAPGGGLRCSQIECDPWEQNCPEDQKCSPYSGDGDNSWEALKCVPLDPDPDHPGEPCTVEGSGVSGVDSCDLDSMCWNVDADTLTGTCVLRCAGAPDAPTCPDGSDCMIANDGVLTLCLPTCDPVAADCPTGQVCLPNPTMTSNQFVCLPDYSGDEGQAFDPCDNLATCDPGLFCAVADLAVECDLQFAGCCLPFCDLTQPPACPGAMQECVPWYDMDPPAGLEHVGACILPQ